LQFPPMASILSAAFITLVGIGQSVFFGGLRPRTASIVVGTTVYCVMTIGSFMFYSRSVSLGQLVFYGMVSGVVYGAVLGYIAGVMVGGVFLIADKLRKLLHRRRVSPDPAEVAEESPATAS
jgi:hypothetical protein